MKTHIPVCFNVFNLEPKMVMSILHCTHVITIVTYPKILGEDHSCTVLAKPVIVPDSQLRESKYKSVIPVLCFTLSWSADMLLFTFYAARKLNCKQRQSVHWLGLVLTTLKVQSHHNAIGVQSALGVSVLTTPPHPHADRERCFCLQRMSWKSHVMRSVSQCELALNAQGKKNQW